jgi:hypothetical protein
MCKQKFLTFVVQLLDVLIVMKEKRDKRSAWRKIIILLVVAIVLKIISLFPYFIEQYYSGGVYPVIVSILRILTGWLPFSIGDVIYSLCVIWLIIRLYKTSHASIKRKVTRESFLRSFQRSLIIILWIYILFNALWGLNYNRLGIEYQLQLEPARYTEEDLKGITQELIIKVNSTRKQLGEQTYPSNTIIFSEAKEAYDSAKRKYLFLYYKIESVKSSLYGFFGNYLGFLGYYNPFTGEAQVNVNVPRFLIPFTTCHEMAHQLGYGDEDEANFAGYLAAKSSKENTFRYSVYFELFAYANRELYMRDSLSAKANYKLLDTLVKKDILDYRKFLREHQNPVEPFITLLYGNYLKANNQPQGIETYDEVVSWLIAYKKKYGEL